MTDAQFREIMNWLKERKYQDLPIIGLNLPNVLAITDHPTVCIPRETLKRFRDDFSMLHAFLCFMLDVPLKDLTPMHLLAYVIQKRETDHDPH